MEPSNEQLGDFGYKRRKKKRSRDWGKMRLPAKMGLGLGLGFGITLLFSCAVVLVAGSETKEEFSNLSNMNQHNCSYTVIIETTCTKGAGTTGHVSLRFGDSTSNDILARRLSSRHTIRPDEAGQATFDDVPSVPFQECATDAFKITGKCIQSQVCYLYLKQRGEDNWRPGRAQVMVGEAPELSSSTFYFRRVLPREVWHGHDLCTGKVTPFGVRQARKVFAPSHGLKSP